MEGIELATAKGRHIANSQSGAEVTTIQADALDGWIAKHKAQKRAGCTVRYNCHGLTFASRRTGIDNPQSIRDIIEDDGYEEIAPADALPGDIVLYFDPETGDAEHSGIMVEGLDVRRMKPVKVVSKWSKGPEAIHDVNNCPYNRFAVRYFRIRNLVRGNSLSTGGTLLTGQHPGLSLPPFSS